MNNKLRLEDLKVVEENIDLDEYIEFREYVKKHMEHPEWLGNFSNEELTELLKVGTKYYKENAPVCFMMVIPSTAKDLKKFEINLDYKEVINYGPMFVNLKYVGNGLQYQMLLKEDEYSINNGYLYVAATIHQIIYFQ